MREGSLFLKGLWTQRVRLSNFCRRPLDQMVGGWTAQRSIVHPAVSDLILWRPQPPHTCHELAVESSLDGFEIAND